MKCFALNFQELETRIDTQKQTLQARDESIKKLLEMLQSKGDGKGCMGVPASPLHFLGWVGGFWAVVTHAHVTNGQLGGRVQAVLKTATALVHGFQLSP